MTLLVAGVCEGGVWMVADMAITGPTMSVREREYKIKLEPTQQSALIGFAGDPVIGVLAIRAVVEKAQGYQTVTFLHNRNIDHPDTDFMYAYIENDVPYLFRISNGAAVETIAAHIGSPGAFSQFQEIRHSRALDPPPDALEMFLAGAVGKPASPHAETPVLHEAATAATLAMQRLFYRSDDRGVGGTAIPYILTNLGARLYSYGYSATDPGINSLAPGSIVMHGTAQFGGYGISVTELRERNGIVIYWLQRPGGTVWLKSAGWYTAHDFSGSPSEFKDAVATALGREVDIWFGDETQPKPESLRVLHDTVGRPRIMVAQSGRTLSFSWIQGSSDDFSIPSSALALDIEAMRMEKSKLNKKIVIECASDKQAVIVTLPNAVEESNAVQLSADELDQLILQLSRIRSEMVPEVNAELEPGTILDAVIDPAWRTKPMLHPAMPGELLVLRHRGLGWQAFVLPPHEVLALGKYLVGRSGT